MKSLRELKEQALSALKGHWFIAIIASFIASILGGLSMSGDSTSVELNFGEGSMPPIEELLVGLDPDTMEMVLTVFSIMMTWITVMAILLSIYSIVYFIVGGAVAVGYSQFNVDLIDGKKARLASLFDSFNIWSTALISRILMGIYTFLWSLLFFIPGIIASFSYAMVPFVLAENPTLTANEAIAESKILMKGNKWRLFCLNFSFIGWYLLGVLTLGIANIWVIPYHQAAVAAFYRDIKPAPVPQSADLWA